MSLSLFRSLLAFVLTPVIAVGVAVTVPTAAFAADNITLPAASLTVPASVTDKIAPSHPYILAKQTDWDKIKIVSTTDAKAIVVRTKMLAVADAIIPLPPQEYKFQDDKRILDAAQMVKDRVYKLGASYQLTGDAKYAKRAYEEMASAAAWPDWNPKHFLDTAEVTNGLGVGYDWIYSYMTTAQKTTIRDAIISKGLQPGLDNYTSYKTSSFPKDESNWNNVCNGGMIVGALAIAKENKAVAEQVLQAALPSSLNGFKQWAPDGGYSEGIGYWHYAMQYTAVTLAALNSATGTDFGLSQQPGFSNAGNFPIHMIANGRGDTAFNYGDEYPNQGVAVENLYLGKLFNNPVYTWQGQQLMYPTGPLADPKALIWYDPTLPAQSPSQAGMKTDAYFKNSETVLMRNGWDNPLGSFAGVKAASVRHGHSDLDLGDFVFSALGESWATELGRDDYNYPGYFEENATTGNRWEFYRKRAEGQNTMVFNLEQKISGPDRDPNGTAVFQKFNSAPTEASAVTDLTAASPTDVKSWKRGVKLFDNKTQLLIQDEVQGQDSLKSAWWFMNTGANIEVAPDGRSAILSKEKNGVAKKVLARIISTNTSLTFTSMASKAFGTSPSAVKETPTDARKLAINITGTRDFTLGVQLTPIRDPNNIPALNPVKTLDTWTQADQSIPTVKNLKVNGVALSNFSPTTTAYDIATYYPKVPTITYDLAKSTDVVTITPATTLPGRTTVKVKSGTKTTNYYFNFENADFPITGVSESAHNNNDVAINSIDGISSTRWSFYGKNGGWIQWDLGAVKQIPTISLNWSNSTSNYTAYTVSTSNDGTTWSQLASNTVTQLSIIDTLTVNRQARFVRVNVTPSPIDPWVAIKDVRFYTPPTPSPALGYVDVVDTTAASESLKVGESTKLTTTFLNKSKAPVSPGSTAKLTYFSADPAIASVDANGNVKALREGATKVTAQLTDSNGRTVNWDSVLIKIDDPSFVVLSAVADTWVNGGANSNVNFGKNSLMSHKDVGVAGDTDRATFMTFDVPATPAGMKIGKAEFTFDAYVNDGNGTSLQLNVHPTSGAIDELKTTWNTKPGLLPAIGSTNVDNVSAKRSVDIAAYLNQSMAAGGKLLPLGFSQTLTTSKYALNTLIYSRESKVPETRPGLKITYYPVVTTKAVADTWVNGGVNKDKAMGGSSLVMTQKDTGVAGDTDRAAFMQFNLPATPAGLKISSVQLTFNSVVDDGGGKSIKLNAHEVAGSINESGLTWNTKPALGTKIAEANVDSVVGQKSMDVSAYAKKVAASGKSVMSIGFSQTPTVSAKGLNTFIHTRESANPPTLSIAYQPV